MKTERDPEFDAISEKDIFEEARDRLKICLDAESENRPLAKDDMLFREGEQWDDTPMTTNSMEEPELVINLTDAFVQRVENNIKQQRPRGKCHPVGDDANTEVAELINGIGRHVEVRSEASVAYDTAARSAITAGWGYFRLISEWVSPTSFQKDLRILPIRNIFTVYMDPSAIMPAGQDQNWCLISVKQLLTEYRRNHPQLDAVGWDDVGRDDSTQDWYDEQEIRLAEYFRIREKEAKLFLLRDAAGQEFTRFDSEMPSKESIAAAGLKIEGSRDSSKRQIEWFQLNGLKVIAREQLPGQWIPVFRVEGNVIDIDGKVRRRGMVRGLQDPQRMVNYGEVAKIKRLGLAPKAPWVAAEGQLDGHPEWDSANTQPYSVLTYKPVLIETGQGAVLVPPPQRQEPAQIEAGFTEFVQGMRTNLLAVAGMPNEPDADMQGQVVSGKALQRRQALSDQSHYQYYDNLTLAIAQCWRVMLEWIPRYFPEERMQRIIGEDSTPRMVKINAKDPTSPESRLKNDLSIGRYDAVMDTGPGYETKREEGADNLIELLKVQALAELIAKTGPDLVFRSIDHPYMQELADRLTAQTTDGLKKIMEGLPERARSIVQALGNENQQLKQALQQAQVEIKYGLQKEHIKAVTKVHDTETRADTAIHDTHVKADTALKVEEIRAGASLMNTHVEAKHHERQAERMIEQGQSAESQGSK